MSAGELTKAGMLRNPNGAVISECGNYRYWLHRSWPIGIGWTVFVMLNPSTADADKDDPTIRRCIQFAKGFGSKGLIVVNLFAWRATDPRTLLGYRQDYVGPENHAYIVRACEIAAQHDVSEFGDISVSGRVICAWGTHRCATRERVMETMGWIDVAYGEAVCLGHTMNGAPKHPLYVRGDTPLERFKGPP